MTHSCGRGNEDLRFIKGEGFIDQLRDYELLKKGPVMGYSQLVKIFQADVTELGSRTEFSCLIRHTLWLIQSRDILSRNCKASGFSVFRDFTEMLQALGPINVFAWHYSVKIKNVSYLSEFVRFCQNQYKKLSVTSGTPEG
jgi:hypothetical protein